MNHFAQKLSQLLKDDHRINSIMLSDIAGISRPQVSRILSGTRVMTPEAVGAISILFDEKTARELLSAYLLDHTPAEFEYQRGVFQSIIKDGNYLRPGRATKGKKSTPISVASTKECLSDIEQAAQVNDDVKEMIHRLARICRDLESICRDL
tara:strand:- start:241 stop:696 length:456 start_codon:yes stop_codon:yes gene_type:complete